MHAIAQVEFLTVFRRRAQQPLEAPAQIRSFADVRLRLGIVATKEKDGGRSWNRSKRLRITGRDKFYAASQHKSF